MTRNKSGTNRRGPTARVLCHPHEDWDCWSGWSGWAPRRPLVARRVRGGGGGAGHAIRSAPRREWDPSGLSARRLQCTGRVDIRRPGVAGALRCGGWRRRPGKLRRRPRAWLRSSPRERPWSLSRTAWRRPSSSRLCWGEDGGRRGDQVSGLGGPAGGGEARGAGARGDCRRERGACEAPSPRLLALSAESTGRVSFRRWPRTSSGQSGRSSCWWNRGARWPRRRALRLECSEAFRRCGILLRALEEVVALGRARGVSLPVDAAAQTAAFIDTLPPEGTVSMQRDVGAGRPSELEDQVGAVVRRRGPQRFPPRSMMSCTHLSRPRRRPRAGGSRGSPAPRDSEVPRVAHRSRSLLCKRVSLRLEAAFGRRPRPGSIGSSP